MTPRSSPAPNMASSPVVSAGGMGALLAELGGHLLRLLGQAPKTGNCVVSSSAVPRTGVFQAHCCDDGVWTGPTAVTCALGCVTGVSPAPGRVAPALEAAPNVGSCSSSQRSCRMSCQQLCKRSRHSWLHAKCGQRCSVRKLIGLQVDTPQLKQRSRRLGAAPTPERSITSDTPGVRTGFTRSC